MNASANFSRRRVIGIMAAAGGIGLSFPAWRGMAFAADIKPVRWRGVALGADARIILYHPDKAAARTLIKRAVDEVRRLEKVFSLYRADSALAKLNARGAIDNPPLDMVRLLAQAQNVSETTRGAFDVTVQPLWDLYSRHYRTANAGDIAREDIRRVLARVGYSALSIDGARIAFAKPGMAATLNGIAQGYITDRVAELLRAEGLDNVLLDLGEIRGVGGHPDGRPWTVGIKNPVAPGTLDKTVTIKNRALATSGGYGLTFDAAGRHTHVFDPRTGLSPLRYASVSVFAPHATLADALSTALMSLDQDEIAKVLAAHKDSGALLLDSNGKNPVYMGRIA
jgi:thiamine biosynthesis lipoprotein